jgi:hypothetical protein
MKWFQAHVSIGELKELLLSCRPIDATMKSLGGNLTVARPSGAKSNPSHGNKNRQYALLCLGIFLCALVPLSLLAWNADKLVALGLAGDFYYIGLLLIGLVPAVILFGILRGYALYSEQHFGGKLELGGPAVVYLGVLIGFYVFVPPSLNFPLTVYVHGLSGRQDIVLRGQGHVLLDIGGLRRTAAIGENGEAVFPEIPANFRRKEINIGLDADGYELANPNNEIRLDGTSVYLKVRKKPGAIAGRVQDETGKPLVGVSITVAGITTLSDATGNFGLEIPGDKIQPSLTLKAVASEYALWSDTVVPNSNEVTITLHRRK